jgi:hypothetical protein
MKKIILWSVVTILIIGIAIAAFLWLRKPQIITLSDGTKLTLLGVTYGKHHVPPKITMAGTRARGSGARIDSTNDTVVVWIEAEHKPNQYPNYQLMVYDQANTACASAWAQTQSQIKNGVNVLGFQLDAFPRRARKIYLRIMSNGQRGQQVSKEQFVVSNPARGPFPKWTPEPLPDTQSDGDLDATLTRFNYGVRGFGFNGGGRLKDDPMNKAVLAAFRTEQKGVVATNWQVIRIETSDATGNHSSGNSWSNQRENDESVMTYQWGLWPDEPAWKLRVEFSKQSGFSDDELWSVTNVPVNAGSQQDLWNYNGGRNNRTSSAFAVTTLNGIQLKMYPVIQFTDQNSGDGEKPGGFRVESDQPLDGMQMTLVKATDERGREVQSWSGQGWGGNSRQLEFQNLRNAKTLDITIALHKSRFVEFTVKPQKAAANGP